MLDEISAAVVFLVHLIGKSEKFNQEQLEKFQARLSELLVERFENHWFPELPSKGQGYRCIRVNELNRRDTTLEKAAIDSGINYEDLKLPIELTIWVDPNEVCYRFGEHAGSYCTLASFSNKQNENLIDKPLDKVEEMAKESKLQMVPLRSNNQCLARPSGKKPYVNHGGNPIQIKSIPQPIKNWLGNGSNMGGSFHPPLQPWYNVVSPPWLSPSPPPYYQHQFLGSPPIAKWNGQVSPQQWQCNNNRISSYRKMEWPSLPSAMAMQ